MSEQKTKSQYLLEFTCPADVLNEAIQATSEGNDGVLVILPNIDELIFTNSTEKEDIISYSMLDAGIFSNYKLHEKIDEYAMEDDDLAYVMPTFAVEIYGLKIVLSKIQGNVTIRIEYPRDKEEQIMYVIDEGKKGREKHNAALVMETQEEIEEGLDIGIERKRARFFKVFKEEDKDIIGVPKTIIRDFPYILLKLDDKSKFSPVILSDNPSAENISSVSIIKERQKYIIKVHTTTETNHNFLDSFPFKMVENKMKEPLYNSKKKETRFSVSTFPTTIEKCLRKHKSDISHIFISEIIEEDEEELEEDELDWFFLFASKKSFKSGGNLYTGTLLTITSDFQVD